MRGRLIATVPGGEATMLQVLASGETVEVPPGVDAHGWSELLTEVAAGLALPSSVILVGERLADVTGGLSAAVALAEATGAKLAWVPRRAGERGAVEAGALPNLLPGGRAVTDNDARGQVGAHWATSIPANPGRDTAGILDAAARGSLGALLVAGVDLDDLPDPAAARAAIEAASFVVSLELRRTDVTDAADVVFPVAAAVEKAGTFLDWEGRSRPFEASLTDAGQLLDLEVLDALADALDVHLGLPDLRTARAELEALGTRPGGVSAPSSKPGPPAKLSPGRAILATWHELLDAGSLQDATPYLAATAKPLRARLSPASARALGIADGAPLTIWAAKGGPAITLDLLITAMPDGVVWVPTRSVGSEVHRTLGVGAGAVVSLEGGSR